MLKKLDENVNEGFWQALVMILGVLAYGGVLLYAGVRSYSLFQATIDPEFMPLATLGVVAMEFCAMMLPLALHFDSAPGPQRNVAYGFYAVDLIGLIANAVLDAAHHSGTVLPSFMAFYGTYILPSLPFIALIGIAIYWSTSPAAKQRDAVRSFKNRVQLTLMSRIEEAAETADVSAIVNEAAQIQALEITRSAVTNGKAIPAAKLPKALPAPVTSFAADVPESPVLAEEITGKVKLVKPPKPAKN